MEFKIDTDKFHSTHLYGKESGMYSNTPFIIDGVFCSESDDADGNGKGAMDRYVKEMIDRKKNVLINKKTSQSLNFFPNVTILYP